MIKHYLFLLLFILLNNIYSQDIYLVIGQSNTAGRGVIGTEDEGSLSNVYLLNDNGDWENAENPTNRYSTIRKDITQQGVNYAYTFGQRLHELTGNDIGLVVNARGGTNINYWQEGTSEAITNEIITTATEYSYFDEAVSRLQQALEAGGTFKGILWHQGEANRNNSDYITKLETLMTSLRTTLGNVPFVAGQLCQERDANIYFNNYLTAIPDIIDDCSYVYSDDLVSIGDLTHYDAASQRTLGERYADEMYELVYDTTTYTQETLYVSEDAYVQGGVNSASTMGVDDSAVLRVKTTEAGLDDDTSRIALLKFDVSSMDTSNLDKVELVVNGRTQSGNTIIGVELYDFTDDWDESTITYDGFNTLGGFSDLVTYKGFYENVYRQYNIDITSYINSVISGDGTASLALTAIIDNLATASITTGAEQFRFYSKDDATNSSLAPYLRFSYTQDSSSTDTVPDDIFLVIGQSNTAGRGVIGAEDEGALSNVFLLNDEGNWENAENPTNQYSTIRKDISQQGVNFAYTFGEKLHELTGNNIGLVVNARGGTNIDNWQEGASEAITNEIITTATEYSYFDEAVTRLQEALAAGGTFRGILWHQGEANRNNSNYITKLETLMTSLRTTLGDVPFVAGQLCQERDANIYFNTYLTAIPDIIDDCGYVYSDDLISIGDLTHYDAASQRTLGERYAAEIYDLIYDTTTFTEDTLYASEDTYVQGGVNSDAIWGVDEPAVLRVKTTEAGLDDDTSRIAFLKFDVSDIDASELQKVELIVNGRTQSGNTLIGVELYDFTDAWSESTLTYTEFNNLGGFSDLVTYKGFYENVDREYSIDITEYINSVISGDGTASLALTAIIDSLATASITTGAEQFRFYSKDDTSNSSLAPYLRLSYTEGTLSNYNYKIATELSPIITYPTPVVNTLNIESNNIISDIELFDIQGNLVANKNNISNNQYSMNLNYLSSGFYIIKVKDIDGDIYTSKIIKN